MLEQSAYLINARKHGEFDEDLVRAIRASLIDSDNSETTLDNQKKIDKYLKKFDEQQKAKERKDLDRVKASYELVKQDEQRQRENEYFDEIVFDCHTASQIHPGLFRTEVHLLRSDCQLVLGNQQEP